MKEWKTIPGFSRYKASTDGEIYTPNWRGGKTGRLLNPAKDKMGYLRTVLVSDLGENCTIKVHRIIASTFLPNPDSKATVNHKNGIKTDNRAENLEWATRSENVAHSFKTGLQSNKGVKNPISKLTEEQVIEIRRLFKPREMGRKKLAEIYGVKPTTIKDIIQRRSWNHLP